MDFKLPFQPERLYCPGPMPMSAHVLSFGAKQPIYHRSEDFHRLFFHVREQLAQLVYSKNPPVILAASGTGAMEASIANFIDPEKDQTLILSGGRFGERWEQMLEKQPIKPIVLRHLWGESPNEQALEAALKAHSKIKAVFFQANETSTGVAYPIASICQVIKSCSDALIIVDGVSGILGQSISMEQMGIDCLLASSQKGLGVPPGLSFLYLSDYAIASLLKNSRSYYFDLAKELACQKSGTTSWTPAVSLLIMLEQSLTEILDYGVQPLLKHHENIGEAIRHALDAFGLKILAKTHPSQTITCILLPTDMDSYTLLRHLKDHYKAIFSDGQGHLSKSSIRMAHHGAIDPFFIMNGLCILGCALADLGYQTQAEISLGEIFFKEWLRLSKSYR